MTFFGDIANQAVAYQIFKPQALTTTTTSTYVDMGTAGGFGTTLALNLGAVSGTGGPTLDVKLQECATTNGTYTDITGATIAQQTTSKADGDALLMSTVFVRQYRYVKAVATVGGTTSPSFTAGVTVIEQKRQI